jgi:hypothetical protein
VLASPRPKSLTYASQLGTASTRTLISEDDRSAGEYEEDTSRPHNALSSSPATFRMVSFNSFVSERLGCNIVKIDEDILSAKIHCL